VFFYNWIFRATPTLLQLSSSGTRCRSCGAFAGSWFKPFLAAYIALSLNEAAYMAEIIRAGCSRSIPGRSWRARARDDAGRSCAA
jgi:ABC-type amino acid transport system permease subunit